MSVNIIRMNMCMHTLCSKYMFACIVCIHAYVHNYICVKSMHTWVHMQNTSMPTCIHTYMHTCIHAYIHTYMHAYILTHMHT